MKAQLPTANFVVQSGAGGWEHAVPTGTVAFYGQCFRSNKTGGAERAVHMATAAVGDGGRATHPGFSATARGRAGLPTPRLSCQEAFNADLKFIASNKPSGCS